MLKCMCALTRLQSIPLLVNSPPSLSQQAGESGATGSPRRQMEAPGARARARSSGEESDSETDSKSSASSTRSS